MGIWEKVSKITSANRFMVILVSRLIPFISFDFISFAAGLSDIKLVPFLFATGIGMLPGTLAYVVLGNQTKKLDGYLILILVLIFLTVTIMKFLKNIINENKKGE